MIRKAPPLYSRRANQRKGRKILSLLHADSESRCKQSGAELRPETPELPLLPRHTDTLCNVIEVIRRFITGCTRQEDSFLHVCLFISCTDLDTSLLLLFFFFSFLTLRGSSTWDCCDAVINGTLVSLRLTFLG